MSKNDHFEKITTEARVVVEFGGMWWNQQDIENYIRQLNRRIKEFEEFLRDHRSQDDASFTVERVYAFKCKHCGYVWDEFPTDPCCDEVEEVFK